MKKYIMDKVAKREQAERDFKEFTARQRGAEVRSKGKLWFNFYYDRDQSSFVNTDLGRI